MSALRDAQTCCAWPHPPVQFHTQLCHPEPYQLFPDPPAPYSHCPLCSFPPLPVPLPKHNPWPPCLCSSSTTCFLLSLGLGTSPSSAHPVHRGAVSQCLLSWVWLAEMHSQVCQATGAARQAGDSPWWYSPSALEARPWVLRPHRSPVSSGLPGSGDPGRSRGL